MLNTFKIFIKKFFQTSNDSKPLPAWDLQIQLPEEDTSDDGDDDGDDGRYYFFCLVQYIDIK